MYSVLFRFSCGRRSLGGSLLKVWHGHLLAIERLAFYETGALFCCCLTGALPESRFSVAANERVVAGVQPSRKTYLKKFSFKMSRPLDDDDDDVLTFEKRRDAALVFHHSIGFSISCQLFLRATAGVARGLIGRRSGQRVPLLSPGRNLTTPLELCPFSLGYLIRRQVGRRPNQLVVRHFGDTCAAGLNRPA